MNFLPLNKYLINIIKLYNDQSLKHLKKIMPKIRSNYNRKIEHTILDIVILAIQHGYGGFYCEHSIFMDIKKTIDECELIIIETTNDVFYISFREIDNPYYIDIHHLNVIKCSSIQT